MLVTAGLVALVFGITQASDYGWGSGETIGIFLASAALLVGFLVWEMRAAEPLMPLSIFRIRTVAGANVAGLTLGTAVFAMFLMLTLYMQQVLTYSPMKTGVAYLAVAGTAIIWSFVARRSSPGSASSPSSSRAWRCSPPGSCTSHRCRSMARTRPTCCPDSS